SSVIDVVRERRIIFPAPERLMSSPRSRRSNSLTWASTCLRSVFLPTSFFIVPDRLRRVVRYGRAEIHGLAQAGERREPEPRQRRRHRQHDPRNALAQTCVAFRPAIDVPPDLDLATIENLCQRLVALEVAASSIPERARALERVIGHLRPPRRRGRCAGPSTVHGRRDVASHSREARCLGTALGRRPPCLPARRPRGVPPPRPTARHRS